MKDISPHWHRRAHDLQHQQESLADLVCAVPHLLNTLTHREWASLMACNRQWREIVHDSAQLVFLKRPNDIWTLTKRNWHSLSVIVLQQNCDASVSQFFPDYTNGSLELMAQIWLSSSKEGISCTALIVRSWTKHRLCDSPADQQRLTQAMSNFSSAAWQPLTQLRIWYAAESVTKQAVLRLRCMLHLTSLDLTNLALLPEDISVLAQGHCRSLTTINLQRCSLSSIALKHLAAGVWPKLEVLYLSDNELDDDAMRFLVKGSWSKLHVLWLDGNAITSTGLATLMHGTWDELWELRINKVMFGDQSQQLLNNLEFVSKLGGTGDKDVHEYKRLVDGPAVAWPRLLCIHVVCEPCMPSLPALMLNVVCGCVSLLVSILVALYVLASVFFISFVVIMSFCINKLGKWSRLQCLDFEVKLDNGR